MRDKFRKIITEFNEFALQLEDNNLSEMACGLNLQDSYNYYHYTEYSM